jgi:adenylyltransferase/sulfurtransferase
MIIPQVGAEGQVALLNAKVLVVGAGGLGCPNLYYLASSGVGTIGIIDSDFVEIKNLHRQILFDETDIGNLKVDVAKKKLNQINSQATIQIFPERFQKENAEIIARDFDVIVDCSDNVPTRYLIDEISQRLKTPFVYGAVRRFEGQLSVFNYKTGPSFIDLFPDQKVFDSELDCAAAGIFGHVTGLIGCLQSNEVMKIILGIDSILTGEVLTVDLQNLEFRKFKIKKANNFPS